MAEGGCLCGAVRIKSTGEVKAKVRTLTYLVPSRYLVTSI